MRPALPNKTDTILRREPSPLRPLANAFSHLQLDDSQHPQTVREERLVSSSSEDHVQLGENNDAQTVREERLVSSSSEDHVQLGENNDTQTVREERSRPLPSRDELLGEPTGKLRPSVSRIPINDIIREDTHSSVTREPVRSLLHYNLPINNGVTHHHLEHSVNMAIQSPTPRPKYNILTKLRDSLASPTSLNGEDIRAANTRRVALQRFSLLKGRNSQTSCASAVLKRSREVDEVLRTENEMRRANLKVLILGASQSGKSVLLDSMKISCYGDEAYNHSFRQSFKEDLFAYMVQAMRTILEKMRSEQFSLEDLKNIQHVETIQGARISGGSVGLDIALAIRALWSDGGVQRYFKRFEMRQWIKSYSYYFDSVSRIALPDYVPTNEDILRSWVQTTCIKQTVFRFDSLTCRVIDVGGLRRERKKWIHTIQDVAVTMFLVDISEYDQVLYEDESVSRMQESLVLWDNICNSRFFFGNISIVLIFTKLDCLKSKLATRPIKNYCVDFSGNPTSVKDVKAYFKKRFLSLNRNPKRKIDVYFTSIVSETQPGRTAFAAIWKASQKKQRDEDERDIGQLAAAKSFARRHGSYFFQVFRHLIRTSLFGSATPLARGLV